MEIVSQLFVIHDSYSVLLLLDWGNDIDQVMQRGIEHEKNRTLVWNNYMPEIGVKYMNRKTKMKISVKGFGVEID